jgi:hypothetical protein
MGCAGTEHIAGTLLATAALVTGALASACQPRTEPAGPPTVEVPSHLAPPAPGSHGAGFPSLDDDDEPEPEPPLTPPDEPVAPSADHGHCLRWRMCQLEGLCSTASMGRCVAASNDDCKPSDACLGGRCTAKEGRCIAGSDEDCRGSWACKGYGRCNHDGNELCIATSAGDCKASTRCQREGECQLSNHECVK